MKQRKTCVSGRAVLAACVFGAAGLSPFASAGVKPANVFGDGMVLQRDVPARVWGTADAGADVTVTLGSQTASAKADGQGKWMATLPPAPAGGPVPMTIKSGSGTVNYKAVYRGDVWLCSGQSNMQMSLGEADNGKATAAMAGRLPNLRLCKIGSAWTNEPQDAVTKAQWTAATPETAEHFSAVGYFFGSDLAQSPGLKDVPIGLIESDLGGTLAEAWAPQEELQGIPKDKISNSMFGIGPTTLYNGMIHPLGPMAIKGVIWYQGEGNSGDPASYPAKLSAVVRGWRKQFQNPDLPFLIVQLPDYAPSWGGTYWQWTRDAQRQVSESMPHVGLVTAVNTNDGTDLHPKPKQPIGQRAALLARQTVYGEKVVGHGPTVDKATPQGDTIRVTFKTNGSPLAAADANDVKGFLVAGKDGKFRRATAKIDGPDAVTLHSDLVPEPEFVRYAWAGVPMSTLTNQAGLPAYPFRTDTLPIDSVGSQPQAPAKVIGTKDYEMTIAGERPVSLVVKNRQILANETGGSGGINLPGFLGPRGFGPMTELGPDLYRFGNGEFTVTMSLDDDAMTWTVKNGGKDGETIRMNLSPVVKTADAKNGRVTLTRPGVTVKVTGVNKVNHDETESLDFKAPPHETTTIRFEFE